MEEIIEHVHYEIANSGYEKKLIGGIVVTGGGSQLKHVTQLFEYMTGITTRIGLPTEHLASTNTIEAIKSPAFSTGIGLVLKGFEKEDEIVDDVIIPATNKKNKNKVKDHDSKTRGSFFDSLVEKSKTFFAEEG
jgi:cell division protein FtsA